MPAVTQPLREEHKELIPHIEHLRTVADSIGEAPPDALRAAVDHVVQFLAGHLIPHAQAEDRALYPVVERVLGAPEATLTMRREHVEIQAMVEELMAIRGEMSDGEPRPHQLRDLQRLLYGLYALVRVHFAEEEEVYLPILDERLPPDEAAKMFEEMEAAAHEAMAAAGAHGH